MSFGFLNNKNVKHTFTPEGDLIVASGVQDFAFYEKGKKLQDKAIVEPGSDAALALDGVKAFSGVRGNKKDLVPNAKAIEIRRNGGLAFTEWVPADQVAARVKELTGTLRQHGFAVSTGGAKAKKPAKSKSATPAAAPAPPIVADPNAPPPSADEQQAAVEEIAEEEAGVDAEVAEEEEVALPAKWSERFDTTPDTPVFKAFKEFAQNLKTRASNNTSELGDAEKVRRRTAQQVALTDIEQMVTDQKYTEAVDAMQQFVEGVDNEQALVGGYWKAIKKNINRPDADLEFEFNQIAKALSGKRVKGCLPLDQRL